MIINLYPNVWFEEIEGDIGPVVPPEDLPYLVDENDIHYVDENEVPYISP